MIRASICLLLVVASALFALPSASPTRPSITEALPSFNPYHVDPNGTLFAFNSTISTMDLYSKSATTFGGNGTLTWFSSINSTLSGQPINDTGFHFSLDGANIRETVNYTLNVPKGAGASTYVRFQWNGTVGPGTGARYLLSNSTSNTNKFFANTPRPSNLTGTFHGGNVTSATGGQPLPCGRTDECFDITKYVGFNITLTFLFNSTATASTGHLRVSVSNVEVASIEGSTPSVSHSMSLDTNTNQIDHTGKLVVSYNSTITYPRPNTVGKSNVHQWQTVLLSFYTPKTYTPETVSLESTPIDNSTVFFATHGFSQGTCVSQGVVACIRGFFFSVNVTAFLEGNNRNVQVSALSVNALTSIRTGIGAVDTDFWTPGDNMTVRVINSPGVNVTGTQTALLRPVSNANLQNPINITLSSSARAGSENYTIAIPTSLLYFGNWNLTLTFLNTFDYGIKTHAIIIDELQVNPGLTTNGRIGAGAISLSGQLSYLSNPSTPFANGNMGVFALGQGTATNLLTNSGTVTSGLYIANVTSVAGVGSTQKPVIMYFSLAKAMVNATDRFDANITIDHEWYTGSTHEVNVTIPLSPAKIDNGNNFQFNVTYSLQALFTSSGIQLTLQSLTTKAQVTVAMTPGIGDSGVSSFREHFGLFRITLHAKNRSTNLDETPFPSVETPPYAYVLYPGILPSRLLAFNSTITTRSDGVFATSLDSSHLLGVKKLDIVLLARDGNGIVLGDPDRNPTVFSDSSTLQPTADLPGSAAAGQSIVAVIHLKSNSTSLETLLTVNLDLTGPASIPTQTKPVTIQPGATADARFTFSAPSSTGTYIVIFSSPQYGGSGSPLIAKTLIVSLVSSGLQIILPVGIGAVAALIIAVVYARRRQPAVNQEVSEETKSKTSGPSKRKADSQPRNP